MNYDQTEFALRNAPEQPNISDVNFSFLAPLKPTVVFTSYWRFAALRQDAYFKRLNGTSRPWSDDPVLNTYKFTNAYRAADRVSQYLIRQVIYEGDHSIREVFFRTILFKIFNRIDTWESLTTAFGEVTYRDFNIDYYDKILEASISKGKRIYSAAYIMPSGGAKSGFSRKHVMHLHLIDKMMKENLCERIADSRSMSEVFELFRSYPTIGDFLAYQYATDINYGPITNFNESQFVIPGPGARDGIRKCFTDLGGLTESELIKFISNKQEQCLSAFGIRMKSLWGRRLQPIDCQNLFCEVDKYARIAHPEFSGRTGRTRIKQKLKPLPELPAPWFPPKWKINGKLNSQPEYVPDS